MKKVLIVLALVTAFALATDSYFVEGTGGSGSDDLLQYDDGTGHWICYNIPYYGVWFDVQDFMPGAIGFEADYAELVFYHHSQLPWDTDQISIELWNGDGAGATTIIRADDVTATHNIPQQLTYSPAVALDQNFWLIANTTVHSSDMLPTGFYDEFVNFTGVAHTFASDDGILWDPITAAGVEVNLMFRVDGTFVNALDGESWGAIKGLFR